MNDHRALMTKALQDKLVPELRARGFKGSLPHFRRPLPDRLDFLTVQFNLAGGSFVVEIAKCGPSGKEEGYGSEFPLAKLNVQYFRDRLRLGSDPKAAREDHWFVFGPRRYDPPEDLKPDSHYERVASSVLPFIDAQADPWWQAANKTKEPTR